MTLATLMVLLVSGVTLLDSFGVPETLRSQLASAPFSVEGFDLGNGIIQFLRNGETLKKMKVSSWEVANGTVRLITPTGKWCLLRCPALVNPFKFTKVVYRRTELHDEIPSWFHGKAVDMGGVYELHLTDSFFVPDGKWNKEQDACVDTLKEEGDFIFKGEVTIRESLLDALKPIAKRYNSYGEFGFSARRETKREAMSLATNRDEKDFIRWYLMSM